MLGNGKGLITYCASQVHGYLGSGALKIFLTSGLDKFLQDRTL